MRGEEHYSGDVFEIVPELPPHARRRGSFSTESTSTYGITSACAEKSPPGPPTLAPHRNYLRMRGEEPALIDVAGIY